jgi:hypothetical protein
VGGASVAAGYGPADVGASSTDAMGRTNADPSTEPATDAAAESDPERSSKQSDHSTVGARFQVQAFNAGFVVWCCLEA